jgi:PadR family transcriptional regulator, regulatory protein PadR
MNHLSRFVEPVVLFLIARKGCSYGYDLAAGIAEYAFTGGGVDRATLYRCLRQLETNGFLESRWDLPAAGPARRLYCVTTAGRRHLDEWMSALERLSLTLYRLVDEARQLPPALEETPTR